MDRRPAQWQADLSLATVALAWGTTFVVVKQALTGASTMYFLALRFALASACLLALFLPAFYKANPLRVWSGLRGGVGAGLFLWLGYVLQTAGLRYTTAGHSGFLTGLYVVLVPILSAAVFRRLPLKREWLGVLVAGAGLLALTLPTAGTALRVNRGDLLTIGCAVAFAFHLLVLGYYSKREMVQAVAFGQLACAAALSGLALFFEPPRAVWNRGFVFTIVLTAVFALQTWGQKYTTPTRTAVIFALEPVFALATACLLGGESLTWASAIGGALILAGVLIVELKPAASL